MNTNYKHLERLKTIKHKVVKKEDLPHSKFTSRCFEADFSVVQVYKDLINELSTLDLSIAEQQELTAGLDYVWWNMFPTEQRQLDQWEIKLHSTIKKQLKEQCENQ